MFDQPPEASVAWGLSNHHCEAYTGSLNALLLIPEIRVVAPVARNINGTAANSNLDATFAGPAVADKMRCFHIACSLYDP